MNNSLDYIFLGICPEPSYRNVHSDNAGWYRFDGSYWVKWIAQTNADFDGKAKYLTNEQLAQFAKDTIKITKE